MDAHLTQRASPILVSKAVNCTLSGRSYRCVWVHEAGRRPYRVPIGSVSIVYAGINAILGRDKGYVLYGYDGRAVDVTGMINEFTRTQNYIVHRMDLIHGEIYYNGNKKHNNGMDNVVCEAVDLQTCMRANIDELFLIFKKYNNDRIPFDVLYNRFRFGFVDGCMVYTFKNIAVVCDSKRQMNILRFMGGDVLVYNGYLLHVRREPTLYRRIVSVYNIYGKRFQQVSVIDIEYGWINSPPFVVNGVGLEIVKRLCHLSS